MEDYAVERSGGDSLSIEDFDEEQCRVSLGAEISRSFTLENGTALKPKVGGTAAY